MHAQIAVACPVELPAAPFLRLLGFTGKYRPCAGQRNEFDRSERARHQAELAADTTAGIDDSPAVDSRDGRHLANVAARGILAMMALNRRRKILRNHDEKPGYENIRHGAGSVLL